MELLGGRGGDFDGKKPRPKARETRLAAGKPRNTTPDAVGKHGRAFLLAPLKWHRFSWCFPKKGSPQTKLHHLRNPATLQIPTMNGFQWIQSGAGFRPSTVCIIILKHQKFKIQPNSIHTIPYSIPTPSQTFLQHRPQMGVSFFRGPPPKQNKENCWCPCSFSQVLSKNRPH